MRLSGWLFNPLPRTRKHWPLLSPYVFFSFWQRRTGHVRSASPDPRNRQRGPPSRQNYLPKKENTPDCVLTQYTSPSRYREEHSQSHVTFSRPLASFTKKKKNNNPQPKRGADGLPCVCVALRLKSGKWQDLEKKYVETHNRRKKNTKPPAFIRPLLCYRFHSLLPTLPCVTFQ